MSLDREWRRVEEQICEDAPVALRYEPDTNGKGSGEGSDWYDAVLEAPASAQLALPLRGVDAAPAGTKVEIKTTQVWTSNGDGRRRGRITVHEANHKRRLRSRALYLVALRDVQVAALVTAGWLHCRVRHRWTSGDGSGRGRSAQLAWPHVLSVEQVDGGELA